MAAAEGSFGGILGLKSTTNLNAQTDLQGYFGNIGTGTKMGITGLSLR